MLPSNKNLFVENKYKTEIQKKKETTPRRVIYNASPSPKYIKYELPMDDEGSLPEDPNYKQEWVFQTHTSPSKDNIQIE